MLENLKNLASLMTSVSPKDAEQATLHNFAFGSIYSMARAKELNYPGSAYGQGVGMRRSREVKRRASAMVSRGQLPRSGDWLAGFYFNDALIRADVCYEHVTRYVTRKRKGDIDDLILWASQLRFPKDRLDPSWREIRKEVNKLKHRSLQFAEGPVMAYDRAVSAITDLIHAVVWVLRNH